MFDGEDAARAKPASGQADDGGDHRHPVRPAEHSVVWIMLSDFGFHGRGVRDIRRIGHHQVDTAVQSGKQAGPGRELSDVGLHELDRGARRVAARVLEGRLGVIDAGDPGLKSEVGSVVRQRHRQCAGAGAQIDDDGPGTKALFADPRQEGLGFRARYEDAGADVQHLRSERGRAGEMLQRHPPGTRGHDVAVTTEKSSPGGSSKASRPRSVPVRCAASSSASQRAESIPASASVAAAESIARRNALMPVAAGTVCPRRPTHRTSRPGRRRALDRDCVP